MAAEPLKSLWLLHGVNLDMLGSRESRHYGTLTLAALEHRVKAHAAERGFKMRSFHTNHEGAMVERLHLLARGGVDAVIINPGAWTHYSYAVHDALEMIKAPVAEVHLSAIDEREPWRRQSVIADLAAVRVWGKGVDGYLEAVDRLAALLSAGEVDAREDGADAREDGTNTREDGADAREDGTDAQ
jgi:3-dehydroquinate dehydratase-2